MNVHALTPSELKKVHAAVDREQQYRAKLVQNLDLLALAAERAKDAASKGKLFSSWQGFSLVNLMHDITECDALYDLCAEIGRELGIDSDGERILYLDESGWTRSAMGGR